MPNITNFETSLGAVMPQETQVRWINAGTDTDVEILMVDVLQL